ncbi:hypothetical protein EDD86DRAFT_198406 [Gorgonomyces haynaldii]|nr:hypothetical protein EDD86DRAFT_198406 [Gorgonomyces haynaldii]
MQKVRELYNSTEWQPHSSPGNVKAFQIALPDGQVVTKAMGTVNLPKAKLQSLLSTPALRPVFDSRIKTCEWVSRVESGNGMVLSIANGQWPVVSDREVLVSIQTWQDDEDLGSVLIQQSTEDDRFPITSSKVRAIVHIIGFCLKQTENGTEFVHFQNQDPSGSIPSAFLSIIRGEQVNFMNKVIGYIQSKGAPPCILMNQTEGNFHVTKTGFNPKTSEYSGDFTVLKQNTTHFVIDKLLYPRGAQVQVVGVNASLKPTAFDGVYELTLSVGQMTITVKHGTNGVTLNGQAV